MMGKLLRGYSRKHSVDVWVKIMTCSVKCSEGSIRLKNGQYHCKPFSGCLHVEVNRTRRSYICVSCKIRLKLVQVIVSAVKTLTTHTNPFNLAKMTYESTVTPKGTTGPFGVNEMMVKCDQGVKYKL